MHGDLYCLAKTKVCLQKISIRFGSCVNVMTYMVAKNLGLTNFKPTKIHFVFADLPVRYPIGVVLNIDVVIGNYKFLVDFVVLELKAYGSSHFGTSFLAIAGAIVDVKIANINLHIGDIII